MNNFMLAVGCLLVLSCSSSGPEALHERYCGSCHLVPDPADLPKHIWEKSVLPEMGARLGMKTPGFDPAAKTSWTERAEIELLGIYPAQPRMAEGDWEKLKAYILALAPDSLPDNIDRHGRNAPLTQFTPEPLEIDDKANSFITFLEYDNSSGRILAGDISGQVKAIRRDGSTEILYTGQTPVVAYTETGSGAFITEIGVMPPTELSSGKLIFSVNNLIMTAKDALHRPVHTLVRDMNGDGQAEVFVSEYGNHAGQLSLLTKGAGRSYTSRPLLQVPGAVRVVPEDMNGDGREDLVVLAAQGDEGIYLLLQDENLTFSPERILRFNPVYGSSWFELADYDGDGDKDIITVNGDNADFSFTLKPYHGLRIFINDGKNGFDQKFFYPIHGATRVLAKDFDNDGDLDMAVTAYFPDFLKNPQESFVYLENVNAAAFRFTSQTFPAAIQGRWLVMDAGDVDGDGDEDILLGSFTHTAAPTPKEILATWRNNSADLMILKNNLKNGK